MGSAVGGKMPKGWRVCVAGAMASVLFGCSQYGLAPGINRADPLGMQRSDLVGTQADPLVADALASLPVLPPLAVPLPDSPESYQRQYRDSFVEQWMARSDILCRQYRDKLIL